MEISWSRCLICQTTTTEDLRCTLRACGPCYDPVSVYASFLNNVLEFSSLGALPVNVPFALDIDTDVLIKNEASWHKSCYLKFNLSKLQKAKERVCRKREKEEGQPEDDHILHAIQVEEAKTVLVRTVDTDVLVILVGKLHVLKEVQPELDLWLVFGMGRNFRFISINSICDILGKPQSTFLPVFHALTGCDTASCFFGKGKKSA